MLAWHCPSLQDVCISVLVRFVGSRSTVRPCKPRNARLSLNIDSLSFRSGRCQPGHVYRDCCMDVGAFFEPSHLKERHTRRKTTETVGLHGKLLSAGFHTFSVNAVCFHLHVSIFTHPQSARFVGMCHHLRGVFSHVFRLDTAMSWCFSSSRQGLSTSKGPCPSWIWEMSRMTRRRSPRGALARAACGRTWDRQSRKTAGGGPDLFCWLCDGPMVGGEGIKKMVNIVRRTSIFRSKFSVCACFRRAE